MATQRQDTLRPQPTTNGRRRTTMLYRVAWWVRLALWWLFAKVVFGRQQLDHIRDACERGPMVYVLQTRSLFDFLYFNYAFRKHRLPLAAWSNGPSTLWLRPFWNMLATLTRSRSRARPTEQLRDVLHNDEPALVFLERRRRSRQENRSYSQPLLEEIIALQRQFHTPIQLIPLVVVWERRSEDFKPSLISELFGSHQRPGLLRRLVHTFQNIWQPFFMMGRPLVQLGPIIHVRGFCHQQGGGSLSEHALTLRQRLDQQLDQVRAVIVGPRYKPGATIKQEILDSPAFERAMLELANDQPVDVLRANARDNLDKIAADFSMIAIKFLAVVLAPLWSLIYDGLDVDQESIERLREVARDKRIVLIPSHKSHIDYLILSNVLFQNGMLPPHIAAGENLDFWPIGGLFRRSGAFFLRREFKGDHLYTLCMQRYIGKLLKEGYPVEFFIEGTRSRTGKLLSPRFGMLRMVIDSILAEPLQNVAIVPCSVTYERVVEAEGFQRELLGGQKRKENFGALLRSTKVLTSRYGRLFVSFGEPLDIVEYMQRYDVDADANDDALQRLTQRLGYRVIHEINQAAAVTPTALTSLALLSHDEGVSRSQLLDDIGFVLRRLNDRGTRLSTSLQRALASRRAQLRAPRRDLDSLEHIDAITLTDASSDVFEPLEQPLESHDTELERRLGRAVSELIDEALNLFRRSKLITVNTTPDDAPFFTISSVSARGELAYYKNTILHALVPHAILSTALLEPHTPRLDTAATMDRALFLSRLFKYEFIYEERAEFDNVFWRTVDEFAAWGWVTRDDDVLRLTSDSTRGLQFFRTLTRTFLASYQLVIEYMIELGDTWAAEKNILSAILKRGQTLHQRGQLPSVESLAKPTFQNALRRFGEWQLVEQERVAKRRGHTRMYRLHPDDTTHLDVARRINALLNA